MRSTNTLTHYNNYCMLLDAGCKVTTGKMQKHFRNAFRRLGGNKYLIAYIQQNISSIPSFCYYFGITISADVQKEIESRKYSFSPQAFALNEVQAISARCRSAKGVLVYDRFWEKNYQYLITKDNADTVQYRNTITRIDSMSDIELERLHDAIMLSRMPSSA